MDLKRIFPKCVNTLGNVEFNFCVRVSGVAGSAVQMVQGMCEEGVAGARVVYRRNDKRVQGGGGIASRIESETLLVCNGDSQVDGPDHTGVSVDYDVCG